MCLNFSWLKTQQDLWRQFKKKLKYKKETFKKNTAKFGLISEGKNLV